MKSPNSWMSPLVAALALCFASGAYAAGKANDVYSSLGGSADAIATTDAASFVEGFNGTTLPTGWTTVNRSTSPSATGVWRIGTAITDGAGTPIVSPLEGSAFALVSYTSSTSSSATAVLSNWMLSPLLTGLNNGDTFSFYTTTTPASSYPDRLEFRLSTNGSSANVGTTTTSVGDYSTLLLSINPNLDFGGYPETWTQYTVTLSGLAGPVDGRVALRYFVTDGGPVGANSNIIGLDSFSYTAAPVPEPATWAMALFGVVGLLGLRRIRQA